MWPVEWRLAKSTQLRLSDHSTIWSKSAVATLAVGLCIYPLAVIPRAMSDPPALPPIPSVPDTTTHPVIITATKDAAALPPIACELVTSEPHKTSKGGIATYASISCDGVVTSITLTNQLWASNPPLPNVPVGIRGWGEGTHTTLVHTTSDSVTCISGDYFSTASGLVVFPPFYLPPFETNINASVVVPIEC